MSIHAAGAFDVTLTPQAADTGSAAAAVPRMAIAKQFHGDLEATSVGQMLAWTTAVEGSAGYVAIERVTGSLGGRTGSFTLQHSGTMQRGAQTLSVTVVPDSGTDQLTGLAGSMAIDIADGNHSYRFDYTID